MPKSCRFLALAAVLVLAGCAALAPQPRSTGPVVGIENLNAVLWYQASVEQELIHEQVYRHATAALAQGLADPDWDALASQDRDRPPRGLPPAVIVDVDETVLDNSAYQARLVRAGLGYDEESWQAWCREEAARPLPGALDFARQAAALGITVFYVTNRDRALHQATLRNLRAVGFPVAGEHVFLGLGMEVEGCTSARASDKGCRRQQVGRTHRVLVQVGDQMGDFVDPDGRSLAAQRAALAPWRAWIGERWFVLPNPTYGGYEAAAQEAAGPGVGRQEAKRAALRVH